MKSYPPSLPIKPVSKVDGLIRPPGSKSITNRALIFAGLAEGQSRLTGVLHSEDTQVMVEGWRKLGLPIEWNLDEATIEIQGSGGLLPKKRAEIFVANSGTTIRFLTAALAACHGEFILDGVPRMRERPIEDLLHGLRQLGASVESLNAERPQCPPVKIQACGLRAGKAIIAGDVSSQFLSGLLMAAPYAAGEIIIEIEGELVSKPYVDMTLAMMRDFGCEVKASGDRSFIIPAPHRYRARDYAIEPDASAASYFWATAAITGGRVRVLGLSRDALQGDVGFVEVLRQMGSRVEYGPDWIEVSGRAASGIDVDMNAVSDTVQTLAAVAMFADGPTRVRGVAHNRFKETDRIGDLATELRKLGALVEEHDDGLTIHPRELRAAEIETYNDHRMAMSLSLIGLKQEGVVIKNPKCVEKTYPNYFEDLAKLTGA